MKRVLWLGVGLAVGALVREAMRTTWLGAPAMCLRSELARQAADAVPSAP